MGLPLETDVVLSLDCAFESFCARIIIIAALRARFSATTAIGLLVSVTSSSPHTCATERLVISMRVSHRQEGREGGVESSPPQPTDVDADADADAEDDDDDDDDTDGEECGCGGQRRRIVAAMI